MGVLGLLEAALQLCATQTQCSNKNIRRHPPIKQWRNNVIVIGVGAKGHANDRSKQDKCYSSHSFRRNMIGQSQNGFKLVGGCGCSTFHQCYKSKERFVSLADCAHCLRTILINITLQRRYEVKPFSCGGDIPHPTADFLIAAMGKPQNVRQCTLPCKSPCFMSGYTIISSIL